MRPWRNTSSTAAMLIAIVTVAVVAATVVGQPFSLPTTERDALNDLYVSLHGDGWVWEEPYETYGYPWDVGDASANPCATASPWQGVLCDSDCESAACHVTELHLDNHNLIGDLPASLGDLTKLTAVDLSYNAVGGRLPAALGNLTALTTLDMSWNGLQGPIPETLQYLSRLVSLDLSSNQLTDRVPQWIDRWTLLQRLSIGDNQFTGTIPTSISGLSWLHTLSLEYNQLDGEIPASLATFTNLTTLNVGFNRLVGTVPEAFANVTTLEVFSIEWNALTGTLPSLEKSAGRLKSLIAYHNQLTAPLPQWIATCQRIHQVYLDHNYFTGSLPSSWSTATSLQSLMVADNLLDGALPLSYRQLPQLACLFVGSNALTGTLPDEYHEISTLLFFDVSSNQLTGTLPASWAAWSRLNYLAVFSNRLTGTFPAAYVNLTSVMTLLLADNDFTGPLPWDHLPIGRLQQLTLASNCFTGQLTTSLCRARYLSQVSLDGLHSSPRCESRALPGIPQSGIVIAHPVTGRLPACLVQLPVLKTLHVGGNSLTGPLPDVALSESLTELVLSSNVFTGEIPAVYWRSTQLQRFDVSFNRLRGTLPASLSLPGAMLPNGAVTLRVNQLSGAIPAGLVHAPDVSMLEGNLFACRLDRSDLPASDPAVDSYRCGSDDTNAALVVFGFVGLALAACLLFDAIPWRIWWAAYTSHLCDAQQRHSDATAAMALRVEMFLSAVDALTLWLVYVLVVVGCIVYATLTTQYPTYAVQFVWTVAGTHLAGLSPAVCLWLCWLTLATVCSWVIDHMATTATAFAATAAVAATSPPSRVVVTSGVDAVAVVVNVVVVAAVNVGFVVAVQAQLSTGVFLVLSMLVALFKIAWNFLLVSGDGLAWCQRRWAVAAASASASASASSPQRLADTTLVALALCNNLLMPFVVELFVSPQCLRYVVSPAPALQFDYITAVILNFANDPLGYEITSTVDVVPPFHYSYQCASSLVSDYAFVFVLRYVFSGVIVPLVVWYAYHRGQQQQQSHSDRDRDNRDRGGVCGDVRTAVAGIVGAAVPLLWKLPGHVASSVETAALVDANDGGLNDNADNDEAVWAAWRALFTSRRFVQRLRRIEATLTTQRGRVRQTLLSRLVTDLATLLCFGVLFPPLALVIGVSLWRDTHDLRLGIGRLTLLRRLARRCDRRDVATASDAAAKAAEEGSAYERRSFMIDTEEDRDGDVSTPLTEHVRDDDDVGDATAKRSTAARIDGVVAAVYAELGAMEVMAWHGLWLGLCLSVVVWAFALLDTAAATVGEAASSWLVVLMAVSPYALPLWTRVIAAYRRP